MNRDQEHFRGCLLGGAVGDALGWPVEFLKKEQIYRKYGEQGITVPPYTNTKKAEITDDTQMTLFTAEGILRASTRGHVKGICDPPAVIYFAYLRWLHTQGYPKKQELEWIYDGWLIKQKELFHQRAPGNTCLTALESTQQGTTEKPINNSKGCGGVMRVAPIGLSYPSTTAFKMGMNCAALTHGHSTGYVAGGALAHLIALLIEGELLEAAVESMIEKLKRYDQNNECVAIIKKAVDKAKSDIDTSEVINQIGEGWVAEEALAVAIFCALRYTDDFEMAIIAAVNHNGGSDSTGAITGNILGAYLGTNGIPSEWLENIELKDVITEMADDLLIGFEYTEDWWKKYPGY